MKNWTRGLMVVATTLLAAGAYRVVHADSPGGVEAVELQGWVVALDGGEVVIDLGTKVGAQLGDSLELWRPIKVKHPVTGKMVTDRFLIGKLRITQVREVVSLSRPDGALLRDVAVADVVILKKAGVAKVKPLPPPTASAKPKPTASVGTVPGTAGSAVPLGPPPVDTSLEGKPSDPEAEELTAMFDDLQGTTPEARATSYEKFAKRWPKGRFAKVLLEEAAALRTPAPTKTGPGTVDAASSMSFGRPKEVLVDTPLDFGIEVAGNVVGAVLYVRGATETTFAPLPMVAAGAGYFRVKAPTTVLRPPFVSYFVEAVFPNGTTGPIEGSPSEPHRLNIIDAKAITNPSYERTFVLWTDFSDYNRLRLNDYAWQTEGFFGLRFGDEGLRAARSGFGVYKGVGGSIQDLDKAGKEPRAVGLTYGYIEGEAGISSFFSLIGRAVIGLGKSGVTGGVQGFFRIGNDKRTNMQLGGEFLGGIGVRGIAQLELAAFPKIPLMFRTEVTNQPAGTSAPRGVSVDALGRPLALETADLGVRFLGQVGYRFAPEFTLHVRASYQGRDINHMGPGFGAGATVAW